MQLSDNGFPFPDFDPGKIFIGREQQIDLFEYYLNRWRNLIFESETDDTLTTPPSPNNKIQGFVVLLYGRGGFGKSTLLKHYRDIVLNGFQNYRPDKLKTSDIIDWEFATEGRRSLLNPPKGQEIDAYEYYKLLSNRLTSALDKKSQEFKHYQAALREVDRARKDANEVIDKIQNNEHYISLRALAGPAAMTLLRWVTPRVGQVLDNAKVSEKVEEVIGKGAEIGVEQLFQLHTQIKDKLGVKLEYYLEPEIRLGLALGKDLCEFAKNFTLLVFFDTYEEIDEGDHLLRILMGSAGLRVGWIIAGRDNLWAGAEQRERSINFEYGYKEIVSHDRGLPIDFNVGGVGAFTTSDIVKYFTLLRKEIRFKPPLPVITEKEAERILDVTQGVPLAVKIAAGLFLEIADLDIVIEKADSKRKIVDQMVERYLLHTRDDYNERSQLYGLALLRRAQIPTSIAAALGLAHDEITTNYTDALRRLHRRYSFIFTEKEKPTLHQEVRYFLRTWLLEHRTQPEIVAVNERLKIAQESALKALEERRQYSNLRERIEDEEWVGIYLDLTEQYFWSDPVQGLDYALPFMFAAAIYQRDINQDTVKICKFFENLIPQPYHRRWEWAAQSLIYRTSFDPSREELNGLEEFARLLNHRFPRFSQSLLSNDDQTNGYQKELEGALCWRLGEANKGKNEKKALEWYEQALNRLGYEVELHRVSADAAYSIAIELYLEKFFMEAISFFNRSIELDPTVPYTYSDRGNTYNNLKEYQLAIADFNRAIELDPTHNHFYNNRGNTYDEIQEYQLAIADFSYAIELDPTEPNVYRNRGKTYSNLKEHQLAIADYSRVIELNPTFGAYINRAVEHMELKCYQDAIIDLSCAIELDPTRFESYLNRGISYSTLGDYQKAITDFDQVNTRDTGDFITIAYRGYAYRHLGRFDEALSDLNLAINQGYKNAWTFAERGEVYRLLNHYNEALSDFNQAITLDENYSWGIAHRGETFRNMDRYDEALTDLDYAIKLDENHPCAYSHRGEALLDLGQYNQALIDLDRAITLKPTISNHNNRGKVHIALEQYDSAIDDFSRAIALNSNNAIAFARRAEAYREYGVYQESLADFTHAFELDPTLMNSFHMDYGLLLSYLGQYTEAINCYEYGIQEDPDNPAALYNTAIAMIPLKGVTASQKYIDRAYFVLAALKETDAHGTAAYGLGGLAAATGNIKEAINYLKEAILHENQAIRWARHDIAWRTLRNNPDFEKLVPGVKSN